MQKYNISIIIPTHNRINRINALIKSISQQKLSNDQQSITIETIVVSNFEDKKLEESLKLFPNKLNLNYRYVGKLGANSARNRGLSLACPENTLPAFAAATAI